MNRPIVFWPSLLPWAKLTPAHVTVSTPRSHIGGVSPGGKSCKRGFFEIQRTIRYRRYASRKPSAGEISRARPTEVTACQFRTPP